MWQRRVTSAAAASWWCCVAALALVFCVDRCSSHGRLIEPPSRASAWRYGFQTPPDYNDHELYCGGFTRQWKRNGGKCGECGDAWDMSEPRPHENGGQWGQGVVVRSYLPESEMTIRVELTASHMGYFEFRLCPNPNAKQDCLDRHLLSVLSGSPAQPSPTDLSTRFYPRNGSRIYDIKTRLPDMKCDQCVLQWRYIAGNNWGICDDGNGAVGCGPQEEFRSCSDIALTTDARIPIRPVRPIFRTTTTRPKVQTSSSTESTSAEEPAAEPFNYAPLLVVGLTLLLLLFALALWYLYRCKEPQVKDWLDTVGNRFCKKYKKNATLSVAQLKHTVPPPLVTVSMVEKGAPTPNPLSDMPPVPPPRTRRHSRIKELTADESSVA